VTRTNVTLIYSWIFLVLFCAPGAAQRSWLLLDKNEHWRKYSSEAEWQKAAYDIQTLETAVVNRNGKDITIIYDVQGESGDWRNIDRYVFKLDGTLIKLERTFGSDSQDIKLTQEFQLDASGKLTKKLEREVSLTTGKMKNEAPEKPQLPIAANIDQLDFMKAP